VLYVNVEIYNANMFEQLVKHTTINASHFSQLDFI